MSFTQNCCYQQLMAGHVEQAHDQMLAIKPQIIILETIL